MDETGNLDASVNAAFRAGKLEREIAIAFQLQLQLTLRNSDVFLGFFSQQRTIWRKLPKYYFVFFFFHIFPIAPNLGYLLQHLKHKVLCTFLGSRWSRWPRPPYPQLCKLTNKWVKLPFTAEGPTQGFLFRSTYPRFSPKSHVSMQLLRPRSHRMQKCSR